MIKNFFIRTGEIIHIFLLTLLYTVKPPYRIKSTVQQMMILGVKSLPIVSITAFFSGMVLAFQFVLQLRKFGAELYVGGVAAVALARELGPVFTSLMVAGRVSSGITAEIGSMKVTEQLDAIESLAVDPVDYLIVPRFIAIFVMLPILTIYADAIGYFGAYLISVKSLGINQALFFNRTIYIIEISDVLSGVIKTFFFAVIISMVGCYSGFKTKGGATGVGNAALISVVTSSILIFVFDYILTALMFSF